MGTAMSARVHRGWGRLLMLLLLTPAAASSVAAEYSFAVHPVLPEKQTEAMFQPLMEYLGSATGHRFRLVTSKNFLVHWQLIRRENYDFVLDGPHFTDYRVQKMGYEVIAKFPAVVSYTLVANADEFVLEPADLIGKRVATSPSPALGALRLARLFPNPLRQPQLVEAANSVAAAEMALAGQVAGAIIPAPLVGRFPNLSTIATTAQVPAPAVSASPAVPGDVRNAVQQALVTAHRADAGKAVLAKINVPAFDASDSSAYRNQSRLLEGIWGY